MQRKFTLKDGALILLAGSVVFSFDLLIRSASWDDQCCSIIDYLLLKDAFWLVDCEKFYRSRTRVFAWFCILVGSIMILTTALGKWLDGDRT